MYLVLRVILAGFVLRDASFHAARPEASVSHRNSTNAAEVNGMTKERTENILGSEPAQEKLQVSSEAAGHLISHESGKTEAASASKLVSRTAPLKLSADAVKSQLSHRHESKPLNTLARLATGEHSVQQHMAGSESARSSAKEAAVIVANMDTRAKNTDAKFSELDRLLRPKGTIYDALLASKESLDAVKKSANEWAQDSKTALKDGVTAINEAAIDAEKALHEDHLKIDSTIREHFKDAMGPLLQTANGDGLVESLASARD
mmetsp:Transcript_86429/g.135255  ORF Transcript_86429/g.135255 Transcript_86429/m.135255 type:complete len:262 (-) Transcript_86429:19-804(-)